ncbi:hypothetical protein [Anaerotalea alkaliphila]|uniref:Polymerase nucleotidyl transferase domain-containing protein n=1 Tax=Anaerotalea alkaliphila TaxID=2662126 RepID=A0A7X5HTN2_9FIRM|nr:hypothetical protein [Anaerotalea alkaliphila]NDL66340.1 hypothetical protein [Anaerotalea alkaliphila]
MDFVQWIKNLGKNDLQDLVWSEAKKINWKEVNRESNLPFSLAYVGEEAGFTRFLEWLEWTRYGFLGVALEKRIPLTGMARARLLHVEPAGAPERRHLLEKADVLVLEAGGLPEGIPPKGFHLFLGDGPQGLAEEVLEAHKPIGQALAHHFPAFRTALAKKVLGDVSLQNALFAGASSAANAVPGPHQAVTAPLEALSDFAVLTGNELRMVFLLAGGCGRQVSPSRLVPEFLVVLGGGKAAQMLATQVLGKIPAGAGSLAKGTIAYAFTYAIGEAAFQSLNFGIRGRAGSIRRRMRELEGYAREQLKGAVGMGKPKEEDFFREIEGQLRFGHPGTVNRFPLVVEEERYRRIHPVKQKVLARLVKDLLEKDREGKIRKILVFGSALTLYCNSFSDIDLVVLGDFREFDPGLHLYEYGDVDLFGYNEEEFMKELKDNRFYREVWERGYVLYEQFPASGQGGPEVR